MEGITEQKGVLQYKGATKDGHHYYEFMQKCEYKGVQFKSGDYISRDTMHHEWEWFANQKTHKGAIEPITGKLYKAADPKKVLKIK